MNDLETPMNRSWSLELERDDTLVFRMLSRDQEVGTTTGVIARFREIMEQQQQQRILFVVDVSQLDVYSTAARRRWTSITNQYKDKIRGVRIVGAHSALLRMVASVMSMVTGVSVSFHQTLDGALGTK